MALSGALPRRPRSAATWFQRIGNLLLHGQGNVRAETFHAGDLVAHAGLHGYATVPIFVQPLLAAVTKQVQPLPGVRGRRDPRKGTAGGDQLGLVQADPRELRGGRSTARDATACSTRARIFAWDRLTACWPSIWPPAPAPPAPFGPGAGPLRPPRFGVRRQGQCRLRPRSCPAPASPRHL